MKIIKTLIFLVVILAFFTSCTKIIDTTQKMPEELTVAESLRNSARNLLNTSDTSYDNYVILRFSQLANIIDRDSSYNIDAFARFSSNGQNIDAGPIGINNNITMYPDADNLYSYHFSLSEGVPLFGTSIPLDVTEPNPQFRGGFANRTRLIMLVPNQIYPLSVNFPAGVIDRTAVLPLTWAPDPNNQYGKVQIDVTYYSGLSQHNATGMPNSVASLSYQVTDNGNFTIPASDLNRFPREAFVGISVARIWSVRSTNNVSYVAYVQGKTIPLLVVSSGPLVVDIGTTNSGFPSVTCSAIVNGGVSPFTYEWRKPIYTNGSWAWGNVFSTSTSIIYNWGCLNAPTASENFKLTVTDALGNTESIVKRVTHKCPRS